MEVKLINGSWIQTMTTILHEINEKLNDTEIDDIIRRIDDTIADEELIEITNEILIRISKIELDINSNGFYLKNNIDILHDDNKFIKTNINDIVKRLNELSIVRQLTIKEYVPKPHIKMRKVYVPPKKREVIIDETFLIDQSLSWGYTEGYKLQKWEGIWSFHPQLYWLINGNKRRLIYKGNNPMTDEVKEIFMSFGIKK